MSVLLPRINHTDCLREKFLLENCNQNIVGSFWVKFCNRIQKYNIPIWWDTLNSEENPAQVIVEMFDKGGIVPEYEDPLYYVSCIIVVADCSNPASLSYVIQHTRMDNHDGIMLLRIMAKHNIPVITLVTDYEDFLHDRYPEKSEAYKLLIPVINNWTVDVWEDYCSYQMGESGKEMLVKHWGKMNIR
ncbi:hypothetical protein QUA74_20215 [Microcoleus sp. LAD1_D3]|uniref:hypothetical protein n=1 Tax=Microcoleus sp. LAD1_D3 TaxID=2819365 RepID=UPI002FD68605